MRSRYSENRRRLAAAIAITVLHDVQNPYYTWMFALLLGLAAVPQLLRRQRRELVFAPVLVACAAAMTFAVMNADTFRSRWVNGAPGEVVARNYQGLEFYALKPIELFLPVVHQIDWLHHRARNAYFAKTMLIGEAGSPYLGVAGILAFGWLIAVSARAVARSNNSAIPPHLWVILRIFAYSVVGGINGAVGLVFELFRSSHRYSIFILTPAALSRETAQPDDTPLACHSPNRRGCFADTAGAI